MKENIDVLSRTIYGEARGENLSGMEAVACVVMNRVAFAKKRNGFWWGGDIIEVCKKPMQFSCWNRNDVNCEIVQKVSDEDLVFQICKRIAKRAIVGVLKDKTFGATHYHHESILPNWAIGKVFSAKIGVHIFYNNIEG